jgi:hypothetical protein
MLSPHGAPAKILNRVINGNIIVVLDARIFAGYSTVLKSVHGEHATRTHGYDISIAGYKTLTTIPELHQRLNVPGVS